MTITLPHQVLKAVFAQHYARVRNELQQRANQEYQRMGTVRCGWLWRNKREVPYETFRGWVYDEDYSPRLSKLLYPDTITFDQFKQWAMLYLELLGSNVDVNLSYEEAKDEVFPFKKYFGINLIQEISNAKAPADH